MDSKTHEGVKSILGLLVQWVGLDRVLVVLATECRKCATDMAAKGTTPALQAAKAWRDAAESIETTEITFSASQECGVD